MYTAADRLTQDTYVVNYKWHCHQIKLNQGYDTSCCPTDWSGWRAMLAGFGNEWFLTLEPPMYFLRKYNSISGRNFANSPPKQKLSRVYSRQLCRLTINLGWTFLVGVSYKLESTPVGRFCLSVLKWYAIFNKICVLQAEVIRNGRKCVVFA